MHSVSEWIEVLERCKALPCSERPYPKLSLAERETWGVFRDWLTDQEEDTLIGLVDCITRGPHRYGADSQHKISTGFLRPLCEQPRERYSFTKQFGGWSGPWACDVTELLIHEEHMMLKGSLLYVWQELFRRSKEVGRACLPSARVVGPIAEAWVARVPVRGGDGIPNLGSPHS